MPFQIEKAPSSRDATPMKFRELQVQYAFLRHARYDDVAAPLARLLTPDAAPTSPHALFFFTLFRRQRVFARESEGSVTRFRQMARQVRERLSAARDDAAAARRASPFFGEKARCCWR